MQNKFSNKLTSYFEEFPTDLLFVKNPDKFLKRDDIKNMLGENGIRVIEKSGIQLRIDFEINYRKEAQRTLYLLDKTDLPEDLQNLGTRVNFLLSEIFPELYVSEIIELPLSDLEILFENKPETNLNKKETGLLVKTVLNKQVHVPSAFDFLSFEKEVNAILEEDEINWLLVIQHISKAITKTIGKPEFEKLTGLIETCNRYFQRERNDNYQQALTASFVKKPRVVSSILKHIEHKHLNSKVALIVIDGMAYWQYLLLISTIGDKVKVENDLTYSWIPSITQLSRQAIFKGDYPSKNYVQNPKNEEKLWRNYWWDKGIQEHQIIYTYNEWDFTDLQNISKYAAVFNGLDDKMHSSTDYIDLKSLTLNWINKSDVVNGILTLVSQGFDVFLTTDHGNVPAKGWRNLKDNEKVGTLKSGSRSARHIKYSEKWLAKEFIESNPDLENSVSMDDSGIYFTDLKSFSHQKELVTHGGSHLLEVIIPFSKITHGS